VQDAKQNNYEEAKCFNLTHLTAWAWPRSRQRGIGGGVGRGSGCLAAALASILLFWSPHRFAASPTSSSFRFNSFRPYTSRSRPLRSLWGSDQPVIAMSEAVNPKAYPLADAQVRAEAC
jgi:hypothetical protein